MIVIWIHVFLVSYIIQFPYNSQNTSDRYPEMFPTNLMFLLAWLASIKSHQETTLNVTTVVNKTRSQLHWKKILLSVSTEVNRCQNYLYMLQNYFNSCICGPSDRGSAGLRVTEIRQSNIYQFLSLLEWWNLTDGISA